MPMDFSEFCSRLWDHDFRQTVWRHYNQTADPPVEASPGPSQPNLNPHHVPYFLQYDNLSGTGYRECFSSTCAMLAHFMKPSITTDDQWIALRAKHGDTTSVAAQLATFRELQIPAGFEADWGRHRLVKALQTAPVALGYFQHGPYTAPQKHGGHWACAIGATDEGVVMHDPAGECDVEHGGWTKRSGEAVIYRWEWFLPRWSCDGPNTGWVIAVG